MTYRINRVRLTVEIYEPFCGVRNLVTEYAPGEDDAFAAAAVEKWREIELAPIVDVAGDASVGFLG